LQGIAPTLAAARRRLKASDSIHYALREAQYPQQGPMARLPVHPGEHLAEELSELGISAAEFARQVDVPVNRITAIINGQRGVTADTALRLGHWFGTSAEFWLNLQTHYELRLARQEVGDRVQKLPTLRERKTGRDRTFTRP
jgi:addiction module HigA family antidote